MRRRWRFVYTIRNSPNWINSFPRQPAQRRCKCCEKLTASAEFDPASRTLGFVDVVQRDQFRETFYASCGLKAYRNS
jgi:hypothetical protein